MASIAFVTMAADEMHDPVYDSDSCRSSSSSVMSAPTLMSPLDSLLAAVDIESRRQQEREQAAALVLTALPSKELPEEAPSKPTEAPASTRPKRKAAKKKLWRARALPAAAAPRTRAAKRPMSPTSASTCSSASEAQAESRAQSQADISAAIAAAQAASNRQMTPAEIRRLRNRLSAAESRRRKRQLVETLEMRVAGLARAQSGLAAHISKLLQHNAAMREQEEELMERLRASLAKRRRV